MIKIKEEILNPIVIQRADPSVYLHSDGYYYFTASHPLFDRIILRRAKSLNELQEAKEEVIWWKEEKGPLSNLIWAPEIHRVHNKWYIYFAAAPNDSITQNTFNHRMYVLENDCENPLEGTWEGKGEVKTTMDTFSLDATVFQHKEELYYLWAQEDIDIKGHSNIYIAKMKNPWTLKTEGVLLTKPEYEWECKGFLVNEGPAVLKKNNKIFITYSGSATGVEYCMGMLTAKQTDDLMDPKSWIKSEKPVFTTSYKNKQYGPGHNSFTETHDGKDTILVYHARNYTKIEGDPLFDPNRHARAQLVEWGSDGQPQFGEPLPDDKSTPSTVKIL